MKFSLPLFALAAISGVTAAALEKRVVFLNAVAVQDTVVPSNATTFCLGADNSDIPDFLVTRVTRAIATGFYVSIPGPINATDCALNVGVMITGSTSQSIATLIGTTTDGTIKLSPRSFALAAPPGSTSFESTYFVSNAG